MKKPGYFHCKVDYQSLSSNVNDDVDILLEEFRNLPIDKYNNEKGIRSRALVTGNILINQQQVIFHQPIIYEGRKVYPINQKQYNIDVDSTRYVDRISQSLQDTQLLQNLILTDLKKANLTIDFPKDQVFFMLNFIKYRVDISNPIEFTSLPNLFHQDGAAFIIVHLVNRENIKAESGFNAFATIDAKHLEYNQVNKANILAKFTMYDFLESYGCADRIYTHYSSSIELADKCDQGSRGVAILLFFESVNEYNYLANK